MIVNFGVGNMFARRTGVSNPTPVRFGVLQDVSLDIDGALVELYGQNTFPADVARGKTKIAIKAKHASIAVGAYNDLFFGQTITAASGHQVAVDEAHTIPSTPYQVTIAPPGSGTFVVDLGVAAGSLYPTPGLPLTRVASSPTTGQYSVAEPSGVYTFAAADTALNVTISYRYTEGGTPTTSELAIANTLMGASPTFTLDLQENYTNNGGVANTPLFHFTACKCGKLSIPMKNADYTINDLDIMAFADGSGNVGAFTMNQ
jgi:hypothetical protein